MRDETLPLSHFEDIYARGRDPWHFADSAYEREKYAASLGALPRPRYRAGFEVGCSIGVLTRSLAERCDTLLAVEPVEAALEAARLRCADQPQVRFASLFVPADWPDGRFDLIVISEVLDYLGHADLLSLAGRLRDSIAPDGDLLLVHWIGKKGGRIASAGEASEVLIANCTDFLAAAHQERNTEYRLDRLTRPV